MAPEPLSNGAVYQSVPELYTLPVHKRPGSSPSSKPSQESAIPVVDLGGVDHGEIVEQVMHAGREFGFFQVINHGVPEQAMRDMMAAAEEFFALPAEEKMAHYSTDHKKLPRFHTSVGTAREEEGNQLLYWRDCLKLGCLPFERFRPGWPTKPAGLGPAVEAYAPAARAVALRLLRLAAAGLGLDEAHFDGELAGGPMVMNVNHYVACPDPSLTLGLAPHCDPNVVTVLIANGVSGLQARRRSGGGGWVDVEPLLLPGALFVNFGHQMEAVTNGGVAAGKHRVVTSAAAARTSVAAFVMPEMGCTVAPAAALVVASGGGGGGTPVCRPYTYEEFVGVYTAASGDRDAVLAHFKVEH